MFYSRYATSVVAGLLITLLLFVVMQAAIKSDRAAFTARERGQVVEFVHMEDDRELPYGWGTVGPCPPFVTFELPTEIPEPEELEIWPVERTATVGPTAGELEAMWPTFPIACPPLLGKRTRLNALENAASVFEAGCANEADTLDRSGPRWWRWRRS